MTAESAARRSSIYDLGYRRYDGPRLGRRYSILSLYVYSFRTIFGLGRPFSSKVFPVGFTLIAMVPALLQLGIAALVPREVSIIRPENYFEFVQVLVALFCAAVAPELTGRDQRTRTLALYFSRALSRADYVTAKIVAMLTAVLVMVWAPQVFLLTGNAFAVENTLDYAADNADLVPAILAAGFVVALFLGSVSLAIACQTSRRAFSTAAVIAVLVVMSTVGGTLVSTTSGDVRTYAVLLSPLDVATGSVDWIFSASPPRGSGLELADLYGGFYVLAAVAYAAAALAVLYRRYQKLAV